jgi:DNA-binding NtrC family response regulator
MAGKATHMATVHSLRPPRVVVAVADARFLRLACFLFSRRGFSVEATKRPQELLELLERRNVDAVILDGTGSVTEAARLVAAVEALHPGVMVVVVAEQPETVEVSTLKLFPKWTSFDQLAGNIERMHLGMAS